MPDEGEGCGKPGRQPPSALRSKLTGGDVTSERQVRGSLPLEPSTGRAGWRAGLGSERSAATPPPVTAGRRWTGQQEGERVDHQGVPSRFTCCRRWPTLWALPRYIESTTPRLIDSASLRLAYRWGKYGSEGGMTRTFSVRLNRRAVSSGVPCSRTVTDPEP